MSRQTSRRRAMLIAVGVLLLGCDDSSPTLPPAPPPTPTPAPAATPTPEPSPENRPPTVSVTSGGACHPHPGRPCTVALNATVTDPDDDRIAFGWDGCAQGNAPLTVCTVPAPGVFTATVLVSDGRGGFARASGQAEGVNLAPLIRFGSPRPPDPAPSNTLFTMVGGQPTDPDDDDSPNALCGRVSLAVSGPCRASVSACGGVGDVFDVDLRTLSGPGTCVVEARVSDSWGAVGTDRLAFQVQP